MEKSLEQKLGVDLEAASKEAVALFFQIMIEFQKIGAQKAVSKKDILRAVKHGFNAGLTNVDVKLKSDQEVWMSKAINELVKCSIVMHAKLMKDASESSEEQLMSLHGTTD